MYATQKTFYDPFDLMFYHSPTIPYDFPQSQIPSNLCEVELLHTIKCFRDYEDQSNDVARAKHCHPYTQELYQCKRRRDLNIWANVKKWETERVTGMTTDMRGIYVSALRDELKELKDEFEKVPTSEENLAKRWRLSSDIMQTEWRLKNIEPLLS